jgi:hypothetical protein
MSLTLEGNIILDLLKPPLPRNGLNTCIFERIPLKINSNGGTIKWVVAAGF